MILKKECSDAKSEIECSLITLSDDNKMCIFKENSCVEQYKSCEAYQNSGATIEKDTCESIILISNYTKKCLYDDKTKTCTFADKKCSDFKVDSIASFCYNSILSNDTKRCSYSNGACSLIDKPTCLELYKSLNATEEICKKAKTSSDYKICSLKSDKSGCDEFSNPLVSSNQEFQDQNGAKYLDMFAIALICLLL